MTAPDMHLLPTLLPFESGSVSPIRSLPNGYIPRDKRKKILLLSDDLRMPSGVGTQSKEMVVGTAHRYNWVQLGAGVNHPEMGKMLEASESLSKDLGIPDAYLHIYPFNGYGDPGMIRYLLMQEKPDAILHFTDPRYWIWLYQMEAEIREAIPIMFYHIWDDLPYPRYNENFYRSCDFISCISKQTYNIVKQVWQKEPKWKPWQIQYNAHGVNPDVFKHIADDDIEGQTMFKEYRSKLFRGQEVDFAVYYNNRNIRRKMPGDIVLAYQKFIQGLPKDKAERCRLVLHTQPIDENGTDLLAIFRDVAPDVKFVFSESRIPPNILNLEYNCVDVVINIASNEGFGLSNLEGMMTERLTIANVTGGLQDQMGFVDENDQPLDPDKHFTMSWGSNHDGRYTKHGEWCLPIFPNNLSLNGSPPTPYIFDDRCDWREVAGKIREAYDMGPEERRRRGKLGREWAITNGFTTKAMSQRFIEGIDTTFANWKPRPRFGIYKG